MKMERQTTLAIYLTPEEEKAFRTVNKVLKQLQDTYIPQASFEVIGNGEIFEIGELSRVRGVIGAIFENTHFRMR